MARSGRVLALPDSEETPQPLQETSQHELSQDAPSSSFLDVLNFCHEWAIPSADLTRIGLPAESHLDGMRIAYALGAGHTATIIRHITDDETDHILPGGKSIAVKTFAQNVPSGGAPRDEMSARSDTYGAVLRELGVFCHPKLSEHPNIVKLLFMGWMFENPFPVLALELGEFGSLDYVLRAPGLGPSLLQKTNMTIDIALGLHALHENGFVHGDLKPNNIVVLAHPDPRRQVIAKLTDFGGTCRVRGHEAPAHVTYLWCAPEVLHGDPDIDWEKSDVYSYGLVAASIFARSEMFDIETKSSSCVLSAALPDGLTDETDQSRLMLIMKSLGSDYEESAINKILRFFSDETREFIEPVVRAALLPEFWKRPQMIDIIDGVFRAYAEDLDRDISEEMTPRTLPRRFNRASTRLFKVWSEPFRARSSQFQEFVFRQLLEEVNNDPAIFDLDMDDIPLDVDPNILSDDYIRILHQGVSKLFQTMAANDRRNLGRAMDKARICFHIALCCLFSIGTSFDMKRGLAWLRAAALGGYGLAIQYSPILHWHYGLSRDTFGPTRLILSLGALSRNLPSLDILASDWPVHYSVLLRIIQQKGLKVLELDLNFNDAFLSTPLSVCQEADVTDVEGLSLEDAIRSYNLQRVHGLLGEDHAADIFNAENSVLHNLSLLRDDDAASLAEILTEGGAKLDSFAPMHSTVRPTIDADNSLCSALAMSIRRGQMRLANTLLDLHLRHRVPVKDFPLALLCSLMYWHADFAQRLFQFKEEYPELCIAELPPGMNERALFDPNVLFRTLIDKHDMQSLDRRVFHGAKYDAAYEKIIDVLLQRGADPTQGYFTQCPLYSCLISDDAVALRSFVRYIKGHKQDPLKEIIDPGHCRDGTTSVNQHTALQTCIYSKSALCFDILLDEFPELIEERNGRGLTALHSATYHTDNLPQLRALLEHGANRLALSSDHSSPLFRALRNRNIEAADLIYEYCTREEVDALFSRVPETGRSLFSRLIDAWVRDPTTELIKSFQWVVGHGGAHFYGRTSNPGNHTVEIPVWHGVLVRIRPSSRRQTLLDLELANLFFDTFPDHIEDIQQDGRGPLHVATWYGHAEIVKSLLQRGANVNLEMGSCAYHPDDPDGMLGRSALNLAILRSKATALPDEVKRGGYEEIHRWKSDMQSIIHILREHGGESGSGATFAQTMEALSGEMSHLRVQSINEPEPFEHDGVWVGDWPQTLPRDATSAPMPDLERMAEGMHDIELLVGPQRAETENRRRAADELLDEGYRERLRLQSQHLQRIWRLPPGWDARLTSDGRVYYVDHNTRSTQWDKPRLARESDDVDEEDQGSR